MTADPRPEDDPTPSSPGPEHAELFAQIPAFDVVDGELMPRRGRR
ncbi:hypothetical protein [Microbacterium radiodurans]|nr:hypothetical protein [Microbacterium radiodurans]